MTSKRIAICTGAWLLPLSQRSRTFEDAGVTDATTPEQGFVPALRACFSGPKLTAPSFCCPRAVVTASSGA